jgi:hypothetical protein
MRPGFAVGGVVISERVPVSQLMVRDVIAFRRPDKPSEQMVHRIIKRAKGGSGQFLINTQGDANTVRVALDADNSREIRVPSALVPSPHWLRCRCLREQSWRGTAPRRPRFDRDCGR